MTDSGPWINRYIENLAIVDLKMTSSGQKKCYINFFKFFLSGLQLFTQGVLITPPGDVVAECCLHQLIVHY